ncbi:MAG TPA: hypothetical protein IAA05_08725 [Candidatus Blautia excrementipullorum]|nr:hypothetical protein [Candidatus Blautia excrementipullorum]
MNANTELLNFIYQNSQMGTETLKQLIEITEDTDFQDFLQKHLEGYERFHKEARQMLNENGCDEKGLGTFDKVKTYLMVNVQTMKDRSVSNIAGMLINGSTMGIIDAVKKLHQYEKETEKSVRKLMEDLQKFEEKNIEELKAYL